MRLLNRHYTDEDGGGVDAQLDALARQDAELNGELPPPDDDPQPPEFERQADGSIVYEDGYRIDAEGRHFNAEGDEVPDPNIEPAQESAPRPQREEEPEARQPAGQQPVVYNEQNMFSEEQWAEIERLQIENPTLATIRVQQRLQQVRDYAEHQFDQQMDLLENHSPLLYERYQRRIQAERRRMTPEQKQTPGAAHQVAGLVMADEVFRLGIADEVAELIANAKKGTRGAPAQTRTPAAPPPAPKRRDPLPPAQKVPSFAPVRRDTPVRNRGGIPDEVRRANPGMSEESLRLLINQR